MLESTLERLAQGRTTVSIAHRISTAERADMILVFDKGEIVEKGEHSDLINSTGIYSKLFMNLGLAEIQENCEKVTNFFDS